MRNIPRRTLAFSVLLIGATASFAAAAKALPCADYVTTGRDDAPGEGHLMGTETRSYTFGGSAGAAGSGVNGSMTVTYEVGVYQFAGSGGVRLDCRDYTYA
jgi:hypothetical protein